MHSEQIYSFESTRVYCLDLQNANKTFAKQLGNVVLKLKPNGFVYAMRYTNTISILIYEKRKKENKSKLLGCEGIVICLK